MTNTQKRVILFLTALPLLAFLMFLKVAYHLPINLVVIIVAIIATYEMATMLKAGDFDINPLPISIAVGVFEILSYLNVAHIISNQIIIVYTLLILITVLVSPIFTMAKKGFKTAASQIAGYILSFIYPGFLLSYIIRFSESAFGTHIIIIFMLSVYLNDSNAWLWGTLFGKNSKKPFTVSPNKSLIGFCGGIFASLVVTISSYFLFPTLFDGPLFIMICLGFLTGITTILGDLIESVLKRSTGVKDSGTIIMGRGGLLDSIDSLLLTAPVFYYLLGLASSQI